MTHTEVRQVLEQTAERVGPVLYAVKTRIPRTAEKGDQLRVTVAQRNQAGEVVGGATMIYVVR